MWNECTANEVTVVKGFLFLNQLTLNVIRHNWDDKFCELNSVYFYHERRRFGYCGGRKWTWQKDTNQIHSDHSDYVIHFCPGVFKCYHRNLSIPPGGEFVDSFDQMGTRDIVQLEVQSVMIFSCIQSGERLSYSTNTRFWWRSTPLPPSLVPPWEAIYQVNWVERVPSWWQLWLFSLPQTSSTRRFL